MPLKRKGKKCVAVNIREMTKSGHPHRQAVAAAMRACGKSKKRGK